MNSWSYKVSQTCQWRTSLHVIYIVYVLPFLLKIERCFWQLDMFCSIYKHFKQDIYNIHQPWMFHAIYSSTWSLSNTLKHSSKIHKMTNIDGYHLFCRHQARKNKANIDYAVIKSSDFCLVSFDYIHQVLMYTLILSCVYYKIVGSVATNDVVSSTLSASESFESFDAHKWYF